MGEVSPLESTRTHWLLPLVMKESERQVVPQGAVIARPPTEAPGTWLDAYLAAEIAAG